VARRLFDEVEDMSELLAKMNEDSDESQQT
jgi:hypothetical protein